jgi:hypothetical protein
VLDDYSEPTSLIAQRVALPERKEREERTSRNVYTKEVRAIGRVASNHYLLLLTAAGGIGYWSFMLALTLGGRGAEVVRQSLLADWTAQMDNTHVDHYIKLYIAYSLISNVLGGTRWIWLYGVGNVGMYNRGCRLIHDLFLERLCKAPLQFFESTPTGRLLNVVGQDIWKIDSGSGDDVGRKSRYGCADDRTSLPGDNIYHLQHNLVLLSAGEFVSGVADDSACSSSS